MIVSLSVNQQEGGGGPEVYVALQPNLNKVVLLQMDNKAWGGGAVHTTHV